MRVRVLTVPSGMSQALGDLALRELAPVRELDHVPFVLRQLLDRAVDAPGEPRRLGALVRAGAGRRLVVEISTAGSGRAPGAVHDRVARDRVEPGGARPPRRGRTSAPSARRLRTRPARRPRRALGRRAAAGRARARDACSAGRARRRHAHRPRRRARAAPRRSPHGCVTPLMLATRGAAGKTGRPWFSTASMFSIYATRPLPDCRLRPPSTTSEAPVTNSASREVDDRGRRCRRRSRPGRAGSRRRAARPRPARRRPVPVQRRTPARPERARARARCVSMACAAFAAQCAAKDGQAWYAATSSTMTTSPLVSRRWGAAA